MQSITLVTTAAATLKPKLLILAPKLIEVWNFPIGVVWRVVNARVSRSGACRANCDLLLYLRRDCGRNFKRLRRVHGGRMRVVRKYGGIFGMSRVGRFEMMSGLCDYA